MPRPRDPEVDRALAEATLALLHEVGFEALALDAVAARAGVSRPALYRRWPTKLHLVAHVLAESVAPMPDPDTGSAREDLRVLATTLLDALSWVLLAVHAEARRAPELGLHERFLAGRHALVAEVVRRGVARGELRGDLAPDLVRDLLLGPLLYHWFATGERPSVDRVFDHVWPTLVPG
ncbi:TetR/AcrR family transcriptional regulator [Actinosynnema mirum]|uniref:Transcriptional regulator, TetR family n=1 Tax=Actinosynnema mirum (strain ATCC 29888 / DSM 43827 / JCM 3225 / NBRC 14064 / NCIMB 13271 / NRRL B-12336 / IMRU 3971 / 101) TaxID=446462 RepID=C6WCX8_ACTMD|nr:TetR/AcrR family transcriptional regulator [Actinosynnema mirum]ACU37597.1 transcriptional regulator, TetR family [Actinosynnema mirum DSM 43827]